MEYILPESEATEVESRLYTNPQVALDESNKFIDNLRSTQQANNQQIQTDTYNLGTAVPSNLGGLTSPVTDGNGGAGMSYFTSRYQVPQTNSAVANLRAVAQAQALNGVLANEQAIWKNRYQNAYRDYQKRSYNRSYGGGGGNNPQSPSATTPDDISTSDTTQEIISVETEALAKSRYQKLLMKYLQAGYPTTEAEAKAKEDFGKSISVDAPVEPYGGQ